MTTKHKRLEPIHPGEILLEDFMKPMGVSITRLADEKGTLPLFIVLPRSSPWPVL